MSKVAEGLHPEFYGEEPINSARTMTMLEAEAEAEKLDGASKDLDHYYDAFEKLLKAVGEFAWSNKLEINANQEGVFPAQKVKYAYLHDDAALYAEIDRRKNLAFTAARNLDYWSRRVGYKPMSDRDIKRLLNFLYDSGNRNKMYYRVRRNKKKAVLASVVDLIMEIRGSATAQVSE